MVVSAERGSPVGISNYVGIRACARPIGYSGVVEYGDAGTAPAVNYAEGRP